MGEDELLLDQIKARKVQDRPDITYNGRRGHGDRDRPEKIPQERTIAFWHPQDYFVSSSEDATLYEEQRQNHLYNLLFTRWKPMPRKEQNNNKGLIILWQLESKSPLFDDKFPSTNILSSKEIYDNMKKQSYRLSLEDLIAQLQKTSIVCASPALLGTPEAKAIQNNENLKEIIDFHTILTFEDNKIEVKDNIEINPIKK